MTSGGDAAPRLVLDSGAAGARHHGWRSCTIPGVLRRRGESLVGVLGLYISVVTPVQRWEGWGPCWLEHGLGVQLLEKVWIC